MFSCSSGYTVYDFQLSADSILSSYYSGRRVTILKNKEGKEKDPSDDLPVLFYIMYIVREVV